MGEIFDFSKTAARKNKNPSKSNLPLQEKEKEDIKKEYGFNMSGDFEKEILVPVPTFYYVSKDFDRLYLGWLDKDPMDENKKRTIRIVMKQLFRFIFGTKKIINVNDFFTKQRIAYTDLEPKDKIPCENILLDHLKKSLEYRRGVLEEEIQTASEAYNKTLYVEKKQMTQFEIVQNLTYIQQKENKNCISYEYDPKMKTDKTTVEDEMVTRLMKVFKEYVEKKKFNEDKYTLNEFRKDLLYGNPEATSPTDKGLYDELITLLRSMAESENEKAELEDLVTYMSFLLITKNALFKIYALLIDIKNNLEGEQQDKAKKSLLEELNEIHQRLKNLNRNIPQDQLKGSLQSLLAELAEALIKNRPVESLITQINEKTPTPPKEQSSQSGGEFKNKNTS